MYAVRGKREYQEDCGAVIELGDLLILAVADGFNKPEETGSVVSQRVITELLAQISDSLYQIRTNPHAFLEAAFLHIHERTKHHIAGSTLSLVIINKIEMSTVLGMVGDSIVVVTDHMQELHIHPYAHLEARGEGLQTAFGDRYNRELSLNTPHIAGHELGPESVIIVSSDGLYPVTPENNLEGITELANHYVNTVNAGGTTQDLVNYASVHENSPDNITVAIYKAE